jgi:hypothetical protein
MAEPEFKLTVDRSGAKPTTFNTQKPVPAEVADEIKARRALIHERSRQEDLAPKVAEVELEDGPREDVESVEFLLPDGRLVIMGPPPGISLTMRILNMGTVAPAKATLYRVLMCVRELDGVKPEAIVDDITAQKLSNTLGDNAIDILSAVYQENWPGVRRVDLPKVKKNLRVQ